MDSRLQRDLEDLFKILRDPHKAYGEGAIIRRGDFNIFLSWRDDGFQVRVVFYSWGDTKLTIPSIGVRAHEGDRVWESEGLVVQGSSISGLLPARNPRQWIEFIVKEEEDLPERN